MTRVLPWLLALTLFGCGGGDAARPRLAAEDGFFRDAEGRAVILRGVNVSGKHKWTPYLDYHDAEAFNRLSRDWGMNTVRFLTLWAALEPTRGSYDANYVAAVRAKLDLAHAAGLMVVLDMHQDIYGEGFAGGDGAPRWTCDEARYAAFVPRTPWFLSYTEENVMACVDGFWASAELRASYVTAWRELARAFGQHPAVVGFDPMNEPFWGSASLEEFEEQHMLPLFEEVTRAVRGPAPHWIAFIEPSASRNLGFSTNLPALPPNAAYAPHIYDSTAEGGSGFDPSRREALEGNVGQLAREATSLGAPLWLGEFGGVAAHPGIDNYMDTVYDAAGAVSASAVYWHYGKDGGYGLLDEAGAEKTAIVDVVVRPYPERLAGAPVSFGIDAAGVFSVTFDSDPRIAAPSVLVLPARHYPGGAEINCGGCRVEQTAGRAQLHDVPAGRITVSVRRR